MVKVFVICPNEYIGDMMALITEKRGAVDHTETLDSRRVMLTGMLPKPIAWPILKISALLIRPDSRSVTAANI